MSVVWLLLLTSDNCGLLHLVFHGGTAAILSRPHNIRCTNVRVCCVLSVMLSSDSDKSARTTSKTPEEH
jgi:hypothetical protein